ncbi:hypothetical protein [Nostoc sp. FACHB-145]|uniref:hypothetical protein n=1 Tax=Nostoc sp. FACHB-145 TaxID=2692836 RepID=UPI0016844E04|nr:hypothetical protein [Nostoc sp. FACHB-145]MBD2472644.1 hypothetical protein [Nostoc sp. FACHB-145]
MNKFWIKTFLTVMLIETLFGCTQASPTQKTEQNFTPQNSTNLPSTLSFKGGLVIKGDWTKPVGHPCGVLDVKNAAIKGTDAYLNPAIQKLKVVVKNAKSEVVALGQPNDGQLIKLNNQAVNYCLYPVTITNVPSSEFYTVIIGKLEQTFSKEEIQKGDSYIITDNDTIVNMIVN